MATPNLDSTPKPGSEGTPNPSTSNDAGGQPSSGFDAAKLQSTLDALTKRLDEVDARSKSLQGDKDRGVKATRREVEEIKKQLAEIDKLKRTGLNEDDAIEEFTFRDEVRQLREQLSRLNPTSTQSGGNGNGGAVDTAKVIEELQLDATDARVNQLIGQYGNDPVTLTLQLGKYAKTLANPTAPDLSSAPVASGGSSSGKPSTEKLLADYTNEMRAARGNRRLLLETKEKFKKAGLDVDNVVFT